MKNRTGKFFALLGIVFIIAAIWNTGGLQGLFEKQRVYSNAEYEKDSFINLGILNPNETVELESGEYYMFIKNDKATLKGLDPQGAVKTSKFKAKTFSKSKKDKTQILRNGFHPVVRACNSSLRNCPDYDFSRVVNNSNTTYEVIQVNEERVQERNTWLGVIYLLTVLLLAIYIVGGDKLIGKF